MVKKQKTNLEKVQDIIHQGNVVRLVMIDKSGNKSVDLSITQTVILTIFLAPLMVLGLVLYLLDGHSIEIVTPKTK